MKLLSYNGFSFNVPNVDFYHGDVLWQNLSRQWANSPSFASRRNAHPKYTGMVISERTIPVHFSWQGNGSGFWSNWHALYAALDITNPEPRPLLALLDDGTTIVQRMAIVSPVGPPDGTVNQCDVIFYSEDPTWHAQSLTTIGPTTVANTVYGGIDVVNGGQSRSYGHLRIAPSGTSPLTTRRFTITNNGTRTLRMFPWRVDFGANTFNASPPSPAYKALLKDGVLQRCDLVNWFGRQAYMWMVIDELAPGARADYELLESTSYIMPGTGFNSYTRPAFDTSWLLGTQTGTGTTTTIAITGAAWATNQWVGAEVKMLTGSNTAASNRTVVSNTATTLTVTPAWSVANAAGNEALITMSNNGNWVWNVKTTERNDSNRGLWWLNRGQSVPSQVRFDVPGGWYRYLYANNDDEKTQARWSAINPGAGTDDYFSILNAQRIWKDGANYSERNTGDGVALMMPVEILTLKLDYQLLNPNRTSAMIVGAREAGSEDFGTKYRDDAMYAALTTSSVQTVAIGGGATQVYVGLINRFGDSMGADWPKDSGTATSGTSTTLVDATKAWSVNHWLAATVRITGGTGIGQARTVTGQTGNTLTTAAWTITPDATSQYTLTLPANSAQLMSNTVWEMTWDASSISSLPPAAAVTAYLLERNIYIGRPLVSDPAPYQWIRTDQAYTGRYLVLTSTERLEIDGETMDLAVTDSFAGVELRKVPGAAVVLDVDAAGTTRLAERWLWLKPGTTAIRAAALANSPVYALTNWHTAGWDG
jgi:hypothetical protein